MNMQEKFNLVYLRRAMIDIFKKYGKNRDALFVEKLDDTQIILLYQLIKIKDESERKKKFQEINMKHKKAYEDMKHTVQDIYKIKRQIEEAKSNVQDKAILDSLDQELALWGEI